MEEQEAQEHPFWYRVASLRPRLRSHLSINRQIYRGERWYVLRDESSHRTHRFRPEALQILQLLDGERSVADIRQLLVDKLGDDAPGQDAMIRLLARLHGNDLLVMDEVVNLEELNTRQRTQRRSKMIARFWSPLFIRIPLYDPNALLTRMLPGLRFLFSPATFLVWALTVAMGLGLAIYNWGELTGNLADRVLAPNNLLILLLVYPFIKLIHELGHAIVTRHWGGEVHEVGVMLLVFVPVPYVEASSAAAFPRKSQRALVGMAGILAELFLASIAMAIWVTVEPGLVRAVAFNVIVIGSVSTILFNGNPLMRFDGYYVMADLVEIPNLAPRSTRYIGYLIQKYLLGSASPASPVTHPSERGWLFFYGIGSFCYRMFISITIVLFVAGQYFFIGALLAVWALTTMIVIPLLRSARTLVTGDVFALNRGAAILRSVVLVGGVGGLLFGVPVSSWTTAEGVVWLPERYQVRAEVSGVVTRMHRDSNEMIEAGELLFETDDAIVRAERNLTRYRLAELQARYGGVARRDRTEAQVIREQIATVQTQLNQQQQRIEQLRMMAPASGELVVPRAEDLLDRYLKQGDIVAYVVNQPLDTVRVAVSQDAMGLMRKGVRAVNLRFSDEVRSVYPARVSREVPAATHALPSAALGKSGGGSIAVDPADPEGLKSFEPVFLYDLEVEGDLPRRYLGSRVYVRFEHEREPVAFQVYRAARQLLLRRLSV